MVGRRSGPLRTAVIASLCAVAPAGVFAQGGSLEGSWTGGGYAEVTSGQRENVSCRVRYIRESADVFGVSAVCASKSVKLTQTGSVSRVAANRYIGDLYNAEYDVAGRVRIVVSGSSQSVTMTSKRGSGSLTLSRR